MVRIRINTNPNSNLSKPAERQGRKALGLKRQKLFYDCQVASCLFDVPVGFFILSKNYKVIALNENYMN